MSPPRQWKPILDGAAAARAREAVRAVAAHLIATSPMEEDASLGSGIAGHAVFFAHLERAWPEEATRHRHVHDQLLNRAVDVVASRPMRPSYYAGFTGIAWANESSLALLGHVDAEDPNEGVDESLLHYLGHVPTACPHYDLIEGLVGLGVYAMDRVPRPSAAALLERLVAILGARAQPATGGVTWWTPGEILSASQRDPFSDGFYNLGLAHGVPGVIAFLGHVCAKGIAIPETRALLDGAIAWLKTQQLPDGEHSRYPTATAPGVPTEGARAAWCYGDPGIAAALLVAGNALGDEPIERMAVDLALEVAARPYASARVVDAGLCHGAAGLGHIYQRFFVHTGHPLFAEKAKYWLTRTLDFRRDDHVGTAGYLRWAGASGGTWAADASFLTGATGIALALLAGIDEHWPSWGRILLVD